MRNFKKLMFVVVFLILVISMLQISWEIGLSFFVMITATSCIWIVLKKVTKVVFYPDLILSSQPFRDSVSSGSNETEPVNQNNSASENLIPGVDVSIFSQFREKLNLNPLQVSNAPDTFSDELEDVEQVKVSLSEEAKNLQEQQGEGTVKDSFEELNDGSAEEKKDKVAEKQESKDKEKEQTGRIIGSGEKALEILSRKHHELRRQKRDIAKENLKELEEDIFADELIPIPGGETFNEPEEREFSDENLFTTALATDSLEDGEDLSSFLRETTPLEDKNAEAEGLLKLTTTSCEAGRITEGAASLKSYLGLLKELGQKPSSDVLQLAEKLRIPHAYTRSKTIDFKTEKEQVKKMQDEPEQTNYASVMDGIVKTLEEKKSYKEALPLLKDLLNYNRQRVNISAMDPLYERIERAHSSMKNDEELVASYKEHLAIKQHLDDIKGELHLLDLISAHYIKIGDLKAAKRYQSEVLRVKDGLEYKRAIQEDAL